MLLKTLQAATRVDRVAQFACWPCLGASGLQMHALAQQTTGACTTCVLFDLTACTLYCREAAAARDADVKAAVARLAKIAAVSEMQLATLQLQAEGNRIGQLGISSGGIMGELWQHSWRQKAHAQC